MEYEINSETLAIIPLQKGKSKILELNDEYEIDLTPYKIMENSCNYYGSSLTGRMEGSKSILGSIYKAPIMVEETNNLIFFPTTATDGENNVWICSNNVLNYQKNGKKTIIEWINNTKTEIDIPVISLEMQLLRSAKLKNITQQQKK